MGIYDTLGAAKKKQAQYDAVHPGEGSAYDAAWRNEKQRGDTFDANYNQDRGAWMNSLQGGQAAFEASARGAINAAMPSLYSALQGARENAIQRGVSNGSLATSSEGDIFSAFQKNIANSLSGQALNLWGQQQQGFGNLSGLDANLGESSRGRYGDLLSGALDRKQQKRNAKNGLIGGVLGIGGSILGGIAGGPAGAAIGGKLGGMFGSRVRQQMPNEYGNI